jgi:hypothetical protein
MGCSFLSMPQSLEEGKQTTVTYFWSPSRNQLTQGQIQAFDLMQCNTNTKCNAILMPLQPLQAMPKSPFKATVN